MIFVLILCILFKVTKGLLKVTKVTTGNQKWPKMGQKKSSAKGQSPLQELEEGPRSGPYILVRVIFGQHPYTGCITKVSKKTVDLLFTEIVLCLLGLKKNRLIVRHGTVMETDHITLHWVD